MKRNKLLCCFIIVTLLVVLCGCKSKPIQQQPASIVNYSANEIKEIDIKIDMFDHIYKLTEQDDINKLLEYINNAPIKSEERMGFATGWKNAIVVTLSDNTLDTITFEHNYITTGHYGQNETYPEYMTRYYVEDDYFAPLIDFVKENSL